MEIYNLYHAIITMFCSVEGNVSILKSNAKPFIVALSVGVGVIALLFALQAFGLFVMSKKRGLDKKWLCFIPFAATYQMGRLSGPCEVFGRKMKRAGLWAMIAQIVSFLLCVSFVVAEYYLFVRCGGTMTVDQSGVVYWESLSKAGVYAYNYYRVAEYLVSIFGLVESVLIFILVMGLFKKYTVKNYLILSWLTLFVPMARFIVIFILRNNAPIDFEAYMRAKREAYARRMGSYGNPYGNPYGQNPYNPQPPRAPEEPFSEFGGNKQEPFSEFSQEERREEPFSEFSSTNQKEREREQPRAEKPKNSDSSDDDLFD